MVCWDPEILLPQTGFALGLWLFENTCFVELHSDVGISFSSTLSVQLSSISEYSLLHSSSESLSFLCSFSSLCDKSFPIALSAFACKACIIAMFRSKQELRVSLRRRSEIWNVEVSGGADTFLSTVWSSSLSEVVFYIDGSIARLLFEVKRGDRDIRLTAERACTDFWKWRLT